MAIIIETCPECGHDLIGEMICTNPPIPRKFCPNCGWRWEGKQDEVIKIRFGENMIDSEDKILAQETNVKSMLEQLKKVEIKEEDQWFMNYMEQVAHILGVELDEEFNLVGVDLTYKISKDGMKVYNGINDEWRYSSPLLLDILIGKYKIKKSILTNQEKEYLSAVIKPFRDRVEGISKYDDGKYKCAKIRFRDIYGNREFIFLPSFEKDIQYRGMEADKWYSLKDLEL